MSEHLNLLKNMLIVQIAQRTAAAIRDRYPDAKVEIRGDEIVVYGQQPIDDEFRARNPWVENLVRGVLRGRN